jgi:hypothetical protein
VKRAAFDELAPYVGPKAASQIIEFFSKDRIQATEEENPSPESGS